MKIATHDHILVVYDNDEAIACWDWETKNCEVDESLSDQEVLDLVGTLLSLIHEYINGDSLPLPKNPSDIPYWLQ